MRVQTVAIATSLFLLLPAAWAYGQWVVPPAPVVVHRPMAPVAPAPVAVFSPLAVAPGAPPVIVRQQVYVPGQPIRNLLRAITP